MGKTKIEMIFENELTDPVDIANKVYELWWNWADFHIFVINPILAPDHPPKIITPDPIPDSTELEFVYDIIDYGYQLSTSKALDMYEAGRSMCKLYWTIEKMIGILVEKLQAGGIATDYEVQLSFDGHLLPQRKAFESIINLTYNVVVTNFDPGAWGERYLTDIKVIADKGYGYPASAPRDIFKQVHGSGGGGGISKGRSK